MVVVDLTARVQDGERAGAAGLFEIENAAVIRQLEEVAGKQGTSGGRRGGRVSRHSRVP